MLVEPAENFGDDGVPFMTGLMIFFGIIGIIFGVLSRRTRALVARVLAVGMVREARGIVQGSNLKNMSVSLGEGSLQFPSKNNTGILRSGESVNLVFTKFADQSGKVILLSVNGNPLIKPAQCTYVGGQSA